MSRERKGVEQSAVAIKCSLNLYVELSVGEKISETYNVESTL